LQIAPITAVRKQVAHGAAGPPSSPPLPTHLVRRSALTAAMKRPADAMAGTRPRRGPTDLDAPRIYRPCPARVLRLHAHAGRKRPAGHLARPLDDGRSRDATRNFFQSHRTHLAELPERRPEAGPWQERRGGCGKSSEHDHYFPSRADRFTGWFLESSSRGLFLESRMSFLVSDVD